MFSIGTDCVMLERVEKAMLNPKFKLRILTLDERDFPITKKYLAGRWAAKEALFKALSPLGIQVTSWQEVSVLNSDSGFPYFSFVSETKFSGIEVSLSISHEKIIALATVIALEERE